MQELTERQKDVLHQLLTGKGQGLMAEELGMSLRTFEWHCREIYARLGVKNQIQAAMWAVKNGTK